MITHVQTTPATTQHSDRTAPLHAQLKEANLLPLRHFIASGYLDAQLLVKSPQEYGVELYGPVSRESRWQAVAGKALRPMISP